MTHNVRRTHVDQTVEGIAIGYVITVTAPPENWAGKYEYFPGGAHRLLNPPEYRREWSLVVYTMEELAPYQYSMGGELGFEFTTLYRRPDGKLEADGGIPIRYSDHHVGKRAWRMCCVGCGVPYWTLEKPYPGSNFICQECARQRDEEEAEDEPYPSTHREY